MTVQVRDGEYVDVVINDMIFVEEDLCKQLRICRVTGIVEECLVHKRDAIRYIELIQEPWYREVFGKSKDRVHIRNLKIDLIPNNRIKAVYRTYLYHYDLDSFKTLGELNYTDARIKLKELREKYKYTIINCNYKHTEELEESKENKSTSDEHRSLGRIILDFFQNKMTRGVFE